MIPKNDQNFRKSSVSGEQIDFWRPCRGLSPGKGFAPNKAIHYMTRRAFLALRVIQRQGKLSFNMLVKNWCQWCTKMKIFQNLWIRLISDQFSTSPDVKAYPGMHSLCPFMRLRKSYQWRKVRAWCRNFRKSSVSDEQVEFWRPCRGLSPGNWEIV